MRSRRLRRGASTTMSLGRTAASPIEPRRSLRERSRNIDRHSCPQSHDQALAHIRLPPLAHFSNHSTLVNCSPSPHLQPRTDIKIGAGLGVTSDFASRNDGRTNWTRVTERSTDSRSTPDCQLRLHEAVRPLRAYVSGAG